jgi:tetratricopeptide (TPR) repeat protein
MSILGVAAIVPAQMPSQKTEAAWTAQLSRAEALAEHGDPAQALTLTNALLEQHPNFVAALKVQGMLLENAGRDVEALATYRKALTLAPKDPALLFQVGLSDLMVGETDAAIDLLQRGLKSAPGNGQALFYLSQAYHEKGEEELALKTIRECVTAGGGNALVWQKYGEFLSNNRDNAAAEQWLQKAQSADPNLKQIDFDLGVASFKNMDLPTAEKFGTRAVEQQPGDIKALTLLAKTKEKLSQSQEAKVLFVRILAITPDDASSLVGLGHCELELRNYQAAVDALERALQLDPGQIVAHFYLSSALSRLGRSAEAKHEAQLHHEIMDQNSSRPPQEQIEYENGVRDQVAQLLVDNREDDALLKAQQSYKGASISPGSGYALLGSVYLAMRRLDDAQRVLNHALNLDTKTPEANTYLGRIALLQDDLGQAEKHFQRELSLYPSHSLARAELGEVRYRQDKWQEAAELVADSKTTIPRLLYLLCDSYFRLGKVPVADLTAETIATYAKNSPEVMQQLVDLLKRNSQDELAERLWHAPKP